MKFVKGIAPAVITIAALGVAGQAEARPRHHHSHHRAAPAQAQVPQADGQLVANNDGRLTYVGPGASFGAAPGVTPVRRRGGRAAAIQADVGFSSAGFGSSSLVSTARDYLGTNPTGRGRLWCGAFMDLVLRKTGHAGGGNLARAYASYGTRVSGPQVGAIAVMGRRGGGGHVGVVSGVDANGNPIIISGNHNRTVAETVYPRGRISAYVLPN
jgi:uncharacterized protein (TIGR02594 family)